MTFTRAEISFIAAALGSSAFLLYRDRVKRAPSLPLPPSPAGTYPLIGHTLVLPNDAEHLVYAKWAEELKSDIISLTALGQTIIVINSAEAAIDVMDRRSTIYSDRPQLRVISDPDLLDWSHNTGSAMYGPRWKKQRRMTHDALKNSGDTNHFALMENETRAMMKRLLQSSEKLEDEIRRTVATEILSTVYGYSVTGVDDPLVRDAQIAIDHFGRAAFPANFLVNFIPWLKYIPEWLPGAGWKRTIREWREQREGAVNNPYIWAKTEIASGLGYHSMVKTHLAAIASNPALNAEEEEDYLKWAASTVFGAATDTTVSSSMNFVVAMLKHPEIQARAQQEIDRVTHGERLPEISDRDSMPYLECIVKEVIRWHPPLLLGVPHALSQDDEYRGYFMPKDAIIIGNIWAMTRDKSIYKDPETFNPDRWLDQSLPEAPVFGFGRRSCPGNQYAEATLFIMIASMLAIFNIRPRTDPATGQEIIPEGKVTTNTLVSYPLPFEYLITPRSGSHKELIALF